MKAEQKEFMATTLIIEMEEKKFVLKTVNSFYQEIIVQCETNNKCGNRLVYLNSYNSLIGLNVSLGSDFVIVLQRQSSICSAFSRKKQ